MEWVNFGSAILGAIVGGIITGFFALISVDRAHRKNLDQAERNEDSLVKGFLQAIHDEMETITERYQETMGSNVDALKENQPLLFHYPLVNDYFAVYNGNSFLIGRIADNDLRKQIVKTYTLAKALIDSFRLNNDLVQKYEYLEQLFRETNNQVHKQHLQLRFTQLIQYAKEIKKTHEILKKESSNLLRSLRKKGVLSEARY